ncbi:MAG TPA: flavin reductase family protein [Clostridiales bacterium]|nr:flavin reductase family protein [Clostridiales bacterium]
MMQEIKYNQYSKEALEGLTRGAFLNVSHEGQDNTMTIGWGSLGYIWKKPIIMVMVRYSRHTYQMLDEAGEFTVSIPFGDEFKKELVFCGSQSGRDMNKFENCNITTVRAHSVNAPLIDGCDLHYECKVVYKQAMEPGILCGDLDDKFYKNKDFHVLYYGEIVGTYAK